MFLQELLLLELFTVLFLVFVMMSIRLYFLCLVLYFEFAYYLLARKMIYTYQSCHPHFQRLSF